MGMKLTVEIELDFPDLSTDKHVRFLQYVFKDKMVKSVKILDTRVIPVIPIKEKLEVK